ncbi:MAG: thymidine phosphorylase [Rhizobiales bacterium 65-9]|nr:thymidine phosphorylase [Hyphomicrobiales bacterium]OJY37350.1 MAG: thymidine phosphorylase [Rhizobiales bacterium 65-9]
MIPQEIIRKKRDGATLSSDEIDAFVSGLSSGAISEGQVAAMAMAVFFNGMTRAECAALTQAMTRSGETLDWSDLPGPALDKHSTGGVGDTVSLMLAPAVAACGGYVPMISGRGLGHTGGTLDKLDSIPGYVSQPDNTLFRKTVREVGCAIIGQTANLAPADKRFYAIRDVTATVESIALITASILSKKLSAGLKGLAMDVKCGSGAFMQKRDDAQALAQSIAGVAAQAGLPTTSLITDMNEPLASAAGNAVEVRYAIDYLTGAAREPRMHAIVVALGAEMLTTGGLAASIDDARRKLESAIASGRAAEIFEGMVASLGGPDDIIGSPDRHLARAPVERAAHAARAGFVTAIDARKVGLAVVALGGGRMRADQAIDPAVGLTQLAGLGDAVDSAHPLAVIHARDDDGFARAEAMLRDAYVVGDAPATRQPVILERIVA